VINSCHTNTQVFDARARAHIYDTQYLHSEVHACKRVVMYDERVTACSMGLLDRYPIFIIVYPQLAYKKRVLGARHILRRTRPGKNREDI
jgi:hypothetical protein